MDISPGNIMRNKETGKVVVIDWGNARKMGEPRFAKDLGITIFSAAPETINPEIFEPESFVEGAPKRTFQEKDVTQDIFSLTVTFAQLVGVEQMEFANNVNARLQSPLDKQTYYSL